MNLKNLTGEEMLNAESSNVSFNQATVQQSNPQWTSTPTLAQTSPVQNKSFLGNLSTIYNDLPSSNDTFTNLNVPPNSNYTFANPNLINLNQESHANTPNLQQFSSHYYNHASLHSQPIFNNSLVSNNSVYDFSNESSVSNGQSKGYLEQHVVNTTNNFHHYNISLHHPTNNPTALQTDSSINFHLAQMDNNLLEQNQNNNFLNSSTSALPLTKKRKKLDQNCLIGSNSKTSQVIESTKNLIPLKNSIKKDPDQLTINQTKDENKQISLNRSLNQSSSDNYANYEYYSNASTELTELSNQNNYSTAAIFDSFFISIKFAPFQQSEWYSIYDNEFNKLCRPKFEVYADKGFNYSNNDNVFICQKKNHFQITTHIHPIKFNESQIVKLNKFNNNSSNDKTIYIKVKGESGDEFKKVKSFFLNFYGVKAESPNQIIKIEQSQSDRSKKPFIPMKVNLSNGQMCKNTVGRLHFAETTSGNMRKKGRPNPDQKYFYLVAALCAMADDKYYTVISHSSDRLIVRASNPGQFENDAESYWIKSQFVNDAIYHNGKVGINIEDPEESLVVCGNIKLTGNIINPSDQRIKKNIEPIDTKKSLVNISKIGLYSFNYDKSYGENYLKDDCDKKEIGVLAQELNEILPCAVKNCGQFKINENELLDNFLVINKDQLFFEGINAIKELNKITTDLRTRLEKLERLEKLKIKLERLEYLEQLNEQKKLFNSSKSLNSNLQSFAYLIIIILLFMLSIIGFFNLIKFT